MDHMVPTSIRVQQGRESPAGSGSAFAVSTCGRECWRVRTQPVLIGDLDTAWPGGAPENTVDRTASPLVNTSYSVRNPKKRKSAIAA